MADLNKLHYVAYADGSCVPNPGVAGFGIFSYVYAYALKSKNIKHPAHTSIYFTPTGLSKDKNEPIEVIRVIEIVKAINNPVATNNEAELTALLVVLEKAATIAGIGSVTVITDSKYVVTGYTDYLAKWERNNWKKQDGSLIANVQIWKSIFEAKKLLDALEVTIQAKWVKGHADDKGNYLAHLYSTVGSNYSRRHFSNPVETFNETVMSSDMLYKEFKASYQRKDFAFYFKDLYFGLQNSNDDHYCFLSSSEDNGNVGRRSLSSIFTVNMGEVPDIIKEIRNIYRSSSHTYNSICSARLNRLENKELYRLGYLLGMEAILKKNTVNGKITYDLIDSEETTPFIYEGVIEYPFIVAASTIFDNAFDILGDYSDRHVRDITDLIVKDKSVVFSNKVKHIDLGHLFEPEIRFAQKLLLNIGYDIPTYLALKRIEDEITKVEAVIEEKHGSDFCTLYTVIRTDNRILCAVNMSSKFLKSPR